jgi:hypothetical protein
MVTSVVWQRSGKAARNLTLTMTKMRMKMNMSLTTATFEVTDLEMKATSEVGALMEMETNATLMMKMRNLWKICVIPLCLLL